MRLILFSIAIISLAGCRSAQWHLDKAMYKGAIIGVKTVTIKVNDTLTINGKDSIIEREIEIPCPEVEIPKTRWEVRFDNKKFNDSLKYVRRMYNDSLNNSVKKLRLANRLLSDSLSEARKVSKYEKRADVAMARAQNRRSLFWLGMVIGLILSFGTMYACKRFKKLIFPEN